MTRRRRSSPAPRIARVALPLVVLAQPGHAAADPPAPLAVAPPALLQRAVVAAATRRAVARAGLEHGVTRDLAARARAAGWMPQLSVRVMRGLGASTTQTYQPVERATSDDSLVLDVRVHFDLSRVVFDPSEVAIARVELDRLEQRAAIERAVLELLTTLQRASNELRAHAPDAPEAAQALVAYASARAQLEALTGTSLEVILRAR